MKFEAEYQELNLYLTSEKLSQKCTKKKVKRKSCWGHKPANLSPGSALATWGPANPSNNN